MAAIIANLSAGARRGLIVSSFERLTGRRLVDDPSNLWAAPRAVVAHGLEADPVFFYGNRVALQLFETPVASFVRLPSRLSAEPLVREERARLLERVSRAGFIDDYRGVRISATATPTPAAQPSARPPRSAAAFWADAPAGWSADCEPRGPRLAPC